MQLKEFVKKKDELPIVPSLDWWKLYYLVLYRLV
jgi:hypothetical protein